MSEEIQKIIYLYRITNTINNKKYIGQSIDTIRRWYEHKRAAKNEKPNMLISSAIKKYGSENFQFEVIAACKSYDDANYLEEELIKQHNSLARNGFGYNLSLGGMNAPKSEEWKESMRRWHASMTPEEKEDYRQKHSVATIKQIETQGHPAQGTKRTPEQVKTLIAARAAHPVDYTDEIRQKMSDSHIGKILPDEQRAKMSQGIKENWAKRIKEKTDSGEFKCNAEGCEVVGKSNYIIVNNIRYCSIHGARVRNHGTTDKVDWTGKHHSEESKLKISASKTGKNLVRIPHNKIFLTDEQIKLIINDSRSIMELSKAMNVGRKVIGRIRRESKK